MIEKSLVLLKPDSYMRKYIGSAILSEFNSKSEFEIIAFKEVKTTKELASKHYEVHKDKPFYNKLIEYLTLNPVIALIVQGESVIEKIRGLLGETFCQKAEPNTIRGKYGIWAGINCAHASDAASTGLKEIKLWKEEAGLEEKNPEDVKEEIQSYINRWGKKKINNTKKLRAICTRLAENKEEVTEDDKKELFNLLKEECVDSTEKEIEKFVDVILDNLI
ncbi:MAG: nucleoside-diphosphate kinase [Candidatus Odinarchaeia archaeon]